MGWLNTSNEVTSVMLEISSAQIQKSLKQFRIYVCVQLKTPIPMQQKWSQYKRKRKELF